MLGLECSITCSRDVGVDSERRLAAFEEELEKINWLDKVTNEEVRRGKQANTELCLAKETSMYWPCFATRWTFA